MTKFLVTVVFILSTLARGSVCAVSEMASKMWQSAHSAVKSLGDDAHSYLVSVLGKQASDTLIKTIGDGIKKIWQAAAHALDAVTLFMTELLGAAEIDAKLQKLFTIEGVIFVAKWAWLLVPGFWLVSRAMWLTAAFIKLALFPLNVIFGIGKAFKKIKGRLREIRRKKKK